LQRISLITVLLALCGCAEVTRDQALAVSRRYINDHHLPLPPAYVANVQGDMIYVAMNEATGIGESFPCYVVTYTAPRQKLYKFTVPLYGARVHLFEDERWKNNLRVVR
jgi:hypothetical protein